MTIHDWLGDTEDKAEKVQIIAVDKETDDATIKKEELEKVLDELLGNNK